MPLTELSPQLPALSAELMRVAAELQKSDAGTKLLQSLKESAENAQQLAADTYVSTMTVGGEAAKVADPILQEALAKAAEAAKEADPALQQALDKAAEAGGGVVEALKSGEVAARLSATSQGLLRKAEAPPPTLRDQRKAAEAQLAQEGVAQSVMKAAGVRVSLDEVAEQLQGSAKPR